MKKFLSFRDPIVPTSYPAELVKLVAERGIQESEVLADTGLTSAMLASPKVRISYEQFRALALNALRLTQDPGLGLEFGKRIHIAGLGVLGYAAMSCPDLRSAIQLATRYHKIVAPQFVLHFRVEGDEAVLELEETVEFGHLRPFVMEAATACLTEIGGFITGQPPRIRAVRFGYDAPTHAERYADRLGAPALFGAERTQIRFDAAQLDLACVFANDATAKMAEEQCEALAASMLECDGVVTQVKRALRSTPGDFPDAKRVARMLQTSERSLRRALSQEGTTYQRLLDEARMSLALEYLNSTAAPMEEVARSLGFGSSRSFRRAFKRWTGKTPSALRSAEEFQVSHPTAQEAAGAATASL